MISLPDDPSFDELVTETLLSPEFQEAWDALNGTGIGGREAAAHACHLIRLSTWHMSRLMLQHTEIMKDVAEAALGVAAGEEEAQSSLGTKVAAELMTAATGYLVMGVMLGIATVARRLGLPEEEIFEEEKPVVN